jgi:hypothetical protein
MKTLIYKPTTQERDAVYNHLNSKYDLLIDLDYQLNNSLNDYYDAIDSGDKDDKEYFLLEIEMINKRIKSIYKAANLISKAYEETKRLNY